MTCYYGGKQRIGEKLATAIWILASIRELEEGITFKGYCEPFCGMLGVYQHIPGLFEDHEPTLKYKAGDTNESVIMMWEKAQKGWVPPSVVTEKEFMDLKTSKKNSALKGYVGHQYSYGGQYFMGFSPKYGKTENSTTAVHRVTNISNTLQSCNFNQGSYEQFSDLKGYIIYCDPPYEKTHCPYYDGNRNKLEFDHKAFWTWCRDMSVNNMVFVSGYRAPQDFKCVFSSDYKLSGASVKKNKGRTERLYLL